MSYVHVLFHSIFNFSAQSVMGLWVYGSCEGRGGGGGLRVHPLKVVGSTLRVSGSPCRDGRSS